MRIVRALLPVAFLAAVAGAQARPATGPATQTAPVPSAKGAASRVTFRSDGITLVNGKPFFPIGIWVYEINSTVLADLHEHHVNTVIGNGFTPEQLDVLAEHGLMAVPVFTEAFFNRGVLHPAVLAWYLFDEPEGKQTAAQVREAYLKLKSCDRNHPIGLDHYLWEGLTQYKDGCDFTMTDVYPILRNRDGIIRNVGKFVDEARRVHGNAGWPHWVYIQIFGGPGTDGGKWAPPLPQEVRCMTFIALVHRADAIHYFSYWPQAPATWASVARLNKDLELLTPWLLAEGEEVKVVSSDPAVEARAKRIGGSWMLLVVNTQPKAREMRLRVDALPDGTALRMPFDARDVRSTGHGVRDWVGGYEERVYLAGEEPAVGWFAPGE